MCIDENIFYFNEDSGNIVFFSNEVDILNVDLNNFSLDNNCGKDDIDPWHIKFEKHN